MTPLRFVKMQALGNDFVVLDALQQPLPPDFDFSGAAQILCDRHFGAGGDGLLLLDKPNGNVQMRMWNPDGSEDMCGNGLRCIARLAHVRGYVGENFAVDTIAGQREATIENHEVTVSMGVPEFDFAAIPMTPSVPLENPIEYELPVNDGIFSHVTSLSTGSTHTVIFGDIPSDHGFEQFSSEIETHPWFPERTSVLWASVIGPNDVEVRIWERGVGETLACGTGACAVAVAAHVTTRAVGRVNVHSKGGTLSVVWAPSGIIFKTGPAQIVYEGELHSLLV